MRWLAVLAVLVVCGCTAHATLIQRANAADGSPGGRVRWLVSSARWVMDAEENDGRSKMLAHCEGPYDVVREWDSMDAVVHGLFWSQMYVHHYVDFRCTPPDEIVDKVMSGVALPPSDVVAGVEPPPAAN